MNRILHITDPPTPLGPSWDSLQIALQQLATGDAVHTVVLHGERSALSGAAADQIETTSILWPPRFSWRAYCDVQSVVRRFQPTEIWIWQRRTEALARNLGTYWKVPVYRFVDSHRHQKRSSLDRVSDWLGCRHSVVCQGPPRRGDGLVGSSMRTLPWFLPSLGSCNLTMEREALRARWSIPPQAILAGTAGALEPGARLKDLLWAADLLRRVRDDVYWVISGHGSHAWRLRRYLGQLDTSDRVIIDNCVDHALGPIPALDVWVQPSDWSGDHCGMRTAIAAGLPTIGIMKSRHAALVDHHHTGFLVEQGARNEIARCVNRLASERSILEAMGDAQRTRVLNRSVGMASASDVVSLWHRNCERVTPRALADSA